MDGAKRRLLVVITHGVASDKATIGMTLANAALTAGVEVTVFLTSDGVEVGRVGAADLSAFKPFKPLSELVESFVTAGGRILSCGSCYQHRGIRTEDAAEGVAVAGIGSVVEQLAAGAQVVSF